MTSCHFPLTSASSHCSPRESPCHRRPPRFLAPRDFILATTNGTTRCGHAWANDRAERPGWADKGSLSVVVPRITSFCLSTCLPSPLSFHSIDGATPCTKISPYARPVSPGWSPPFTRRPHGPPSDGNIQSPTLGIALSKLFKCLPWSNKRQRQRQRPEAGGKRRAAFVISATFGSVTQHASSFPFDELLRRAGTTISSTKANSTT